MPPAPDRSHSARARRGAPSRFRSQQPHHRRRRRALATVLAVLLLVVVVSGDVRRGRGHVPSRGRHADRLLRADRDPRRHRPGLVLGRRARWPRTTRSTGRSPPRPTCGSPAPSTGRWRSRSTMARGRTPCSCSPCSSASTSRRRSSRWGPRSSYFHAGTSAILAAGDPIGDHTQLHAPMGKLSAADQQTQVLQQISSTGAYGAPYPALVPPAVRVVQLDDGDDPPAAEDADGAVDDRHQRLSPARRRRRSSARC